MRNHWLLIVGGVLLVIAAMLIVNSAMTNRPSYEANKPPQSTEAPPPLPKRVPAHYQEAPTRASLGPTLAPEQFRGKTRDAYRVVREIPQTIAQLPCYCHCDRGMGHKSLYSCFEDDHAAHCAVCVDEALLAFRLEKQERLGAPEIRDRIVAQYAEE